MISKTELASLPPLNDALMVAQWLSEITGTPVEQVRRQLLNECRFIGHNVREAARKFGLVPHVWSDQLLEFYRQTNAFLYETACWNATRMKQQMREAVCAALVARLPAGSSVLCYGDGMGFDSAALSRCGFKVTCYEVSGPCLDFARRMFELNGLDTRIVTDENQFSTGSFDAVVCLDVLEHVPDPPEVVRKFAGWLRDDGLLVTHAPFYHVDSSRPTHLRSNRRFSGVIQGLYGRAGFQVMGAGGLLLLPLVMQKRSPSSGAVTIRPWGLRLRLGLSQSLLFAVRFAPYVPGAVAAIVCKPNAEWSRQLSAALTDCRGVELGT